MKQRIRGAKFQEHFSQAELFYNSLAPYEKEHLKSAISFELSHCDDKQVYETYSKVLNKISLEMANAVAFKVNGVISETADREFHGKSTPTLSQMYYAPKTPTIATRRIAILVEDGFSMTEVLAIRAMLSSVKAVSYLIGPYRNTIFGASEGAGAGLIADHHFEGQRSTMFDAILIPSGEEHSKQLIENGRVIHWIREAFGHCKVIGAIAEGWRFATISVDNLNASLGINVVKHALVSPLVKLQGLESDEVISHYGVVTTGVYNVTPAVTDVLQIAPGSTDFVSSFAYEISRHRCYDRVLDGLVAQVAY